MKLIAQPIESKLCGQACVAMLLGIPLEDSIKLFGHQKGTSALMIHEVLATQGIKCDKKLAVAPYKHLKGWCSAVVTFMKVQMHKDKTGKRPSSHWVLNVYGKIYDPGPYDVHTMKPGARVYPSIDMFSRTYAPYGKVVSGISLRGKNANIDI